MKWNGLKSEVSEQKSRSHCIGTRCTENHEGIPSQLVQYVNQVDILSIHRPYIKRSRVIMILMNSTSSAISYLELERNKDVVLLELVDGGVLGGDFDLDRVPERGSLEFLNLLRHRG